MEYAQSLLGLFSVQSQGTAADESSPSAQQSTHLPPPDFLSPVRRSRRSQLRLTAPPGKEPLTPLELRLRELVVDLYSDAVRSRSALSGSEELSSEIDSGHFSDHPTTSLSEPHLRSPSPPLAMTTTEPRGATPLRSYADTAVPNEQEHPPLLPSFSADDIAEVGQDPSLPSISSSSNFQFGFQTSVTDPSNLPPSLPPSLYGVRSLHAPPPVSLPLYSYTEPSVPLEPSPKNPPSSDLHSLVSRSFQLPPQPRPNTSQQNPDVKSITTITAPSSVQATPTDRQSTPIKLQATPTERQATPTERQATPTEQQANHIQLTGHITQDDGTAATLHPMENITDESPDFSENLSSQPVESSDAKLRSEGSQSYRHPEEIKTLPYNPESVLLDVESPLSPKEIRDRLADVVRGKTPLDLSTGFSTTAPREEVLSLSVEEREGGEAGREGDSEASELKESDVVELHNFEDAETSSVVSIEQITEALRHDPLSLPTSLTDHEKTPTHGRNTAFSLPLSSSPLPLGKTASLPSKYSKSVGTPPPVGRMPEHLRPPHKQLTLKPDSLSHQSHSSLTKHKPFLPPPSSTTSSSLSSEQQLSEILHTKAHLEGQLEAVAEECRQLLTERAALNSRLAVAEAELEVARRRERKISSSGGQHQAKEDHARLREQLEMIQRDFRQERKTLEAVREDLNRVKASEKRLKAETEEGQKKEEILAGKVRELGERLKESGRELEEEKLSRDEVQHKLRSLQSSYQAVEESKVWMQTQLQETMEEKLRLQEELRASKAEYIASTVKTDQLARENASFLQQITNLQKGVLQDKAKLVSDLEAIEADVLSSEDSYALLVAERLQLEELAQQRAQEIERLSAEVGRTRVERDELRSRETERASKEESLTGRIQLLQRAKREAEKRLQEMERELGKREEEVEKLRQGKSGLQERLRETEAALVGKDGALQGMKDSREVLGRELEMLQEVQRKVEGELEEERRHVARLKASLAASQDGSSEELMKWLQDNQQQLEVENRVLRERVAGGEAEVREREKELEAALARNKDNTARLRDTERRLDSATSECDALKQSLSGREGTIRRLTQESEVFRLELESVESDRDSVQSRLNTAQQMKSRLEGQLSEQSTLGELEQLQSAVKERSALRKELETVRLSHQQELHQVTARQGQTEAELRVAQRETEREQTQLQKAVASSEETTAKLTELRGQMKRELEEAKREVERERKGREEAEGGATGLRIELEEARKQCVWLQKEMGDVRGKLVHESAQKGEVERASGMVALRLKQNAEEKERELREKNQKLSLELEQLRGRLAGLSVTQQALKTHASQLQSSLADRESSLTRLTAEMERLEREKQAREGQVNSETASLKDEVYSLRAELEEAREQLCGEQNYVSELTEELAKTSRELSRMRAGHSAEEQALPALQAKISRLGQSCDDLRLELSTVRAELVMSKTAADAAERELEDRKTQLEILQQRLCASEEECRQRERDVEGVRSRLQEAEEGGRGEARRRALFETSLSSIGAEDTDSCVAPPAHDLSVSVSPHSDTLPPHPRDLPSFHAAQLKELSQQMERARREGEVAAEARTSGEITILRSQLGSKSRTMNTLQSCLVSLRGDMGKLQNKMQSHSATVKASHYTTRQLENQIADLKRSSSLQSPSFLSSPPGHTP